MAMCEISPEAANNSKQNGKERSQQHSGKGGHATDTSSWIGHLEMIGSKFFQKQDRAGQYDACNTYQFWTITKKFHGRMISLCNEVFWHKEAEILFPEGGARRILYRYKGGGLVSGTSRRPLKIVLVFRIMNKNNGRFAAIFLAVLVPVGFWLGLEYLNRPTTPGSDAITVTPAKRNAPPPELARQEDEPAPLQNAAKLAEPEAGGIYKCLHNGRVAYTDKPEQQCDRGSAASHMAPAVTSAGIAPAKPYQQQLAELERDQARNANSVEDQARQADRDRERAAHEQLCSTLADEITWIDSALRQPHDAHTGDDWTARRRRATDRRYSEHC